MRIISKIVLPIFIFVFVGYSNAQNIDSLMFIDSKYDSIITSDGYSMQTLFYKHNNDVLLNNLGTFGSSFYYPTVDGLYQNESTQQPDKLVHKLRQLSGYKPFTNITYINASRKEQLFSIKHIQEFGKLLFLNFDFKKMSSPGAYQNQEANNTFFTGNISYESLRKKYFIEISSKVNRNFQEQNGGLFDTDGYESSIYNDKLNFKVNLQTSSSFLKSYNYKLKQRLDLFSFNSDSIKNKAVYLKHELGYTTQQKVFYDYDPQSDIFLEIFLDSISYIDSIYTDNLSNKGMVGLKLGRLNVEFLGQYDQLKYNQSNGLDFLYHNTYTGVNMVSKRDYLNIIFHGKYGVDGYRSGDIESDLFIKLKKKKYNLETDIKYFLTEPDLKFINYTSNHFIWNHTSFEKQSIIEADFTFLLKKYQLEISVDHKSLMNTLYYDTLARASQDENPSSISSFRLAKNYKVLNFHFRSAFIYQISSNKNLFPLPEMLGRQIIYYQKYIFKGALKFQFGVGFSYSTEYNGYAYMPATGEFYVQNQTPLGYYPQLDIFINTHLKRAQIFLKYEHINAGRSIDKSYTVPGYPILPKSLKFGVSWNMFD